MIMKRDFSGVFAWRRVVGRSGLLDDPAVKGAHSLRSVSPQHVPQFNLWAHVVLWEKQ